MREQHMARGLSEVALRLTDLERMANFYEHVVGLELWQRFAGDLFFPVAQGL